MAKHTTALGKTIDMTALATQHEKTRAVGNMGVNARGDLLDNHNKVIKDSNERVSSSYNKTVSEAPTQAKKSQLTPDQAPIDLSELSDSERDFENSDDDIKK